MATDSTVTPTAPLASSLVVCAGIIVSDLFVPPLAALPQPGQLVAIDAPLYQSGGCAANTAVDLAALGAQVRVNGRVGEDGLGTQALDELTGLGVDVSGVTRSRTAPTSQTVVISIAGDDRRFLHCFGANAEFTAADVARGTEDAGILVVGGYLLLPGLHADDLLPVLRAARARGTTVLLDVAIPLGTPGAAERVKPLLAAVDAFLPNQDEAAVLTGRDDPVEQARTLLDWGCPEVFITCGAGGALHASPELVLWADPLPVAFVDGSGAGDAFTAGVVLGKQRRWSVAQTLQYASALGASVCRGLGCHSTIFTEEQARDQMGQVRVQDVTR